MISYLELLLVYLRLTILFEEAMLLGLKEKEPQLYKEQLALIEELREQLFLLQSK